LQEKERLKSHVVNVPTLKELLTELPLCLGLNIEIKYPVGIAVEHMSREPAMEINRYLDDIFDVLFDHVGRRRIVFSCFHPDICTTIKMKQGRFPVALLCGEPPEAMTDYRCVRRQAHTHEVAQSESEQTARSAQSFSCPRAAQSEPVA